MLGMLRRTGRGQDSLPIGVDMSDSKCEQNIERWSLRRGPRYPPVVGADSQAGPVQYGCGGATEEPRAGVGVPGKGCRDRGFSADFGRRLALEPGLSPALGAEPRAGQTIPLGRQGALRRVGGGRSPNPDTGVHRSRGARSFEVSGSRRSRLVRHRRQSYPALGAGTFDRGRGRRLRGTRWPRSYTVR
jgi:hypothetical protein